MTKKLLIILPVLAMAAAASCPAGAQEPDSLAVEQLQEAVVGAVRATQSAPFAVANIGVAQLEDFSSTGRELPMLLARTPGVLAWSENGVGTGTSYMRTITGNREVLKNLIMIIVSNTCIVTAAKPIKDSTFSQIPFGSRGCE